MIRLLVLCLALTAVGCSVRANVVELGVGYDRHIDEGKNPQSVIRYRNEPANGASGFVFEYDHHSSVTEGAPFNGRAEDLADQWSVIYRWVF